MNIFITGSSGFIGQRIINEFLEYDFLRHNREDEPCISNCKYVIHLAAISLDDGSNSNYSKYYSVNYIFAKKVFDSFVESSAEVFIFFSSIKSVTDVSDQSLDENSIPQPTSSYGKTKLLAEEYILSKKIPSWKRVYILRPTLVYGPDCKSGLSTLFKFISKSVIWPFASFNSYRSFCSIDNILFVVREFLVRKDIPNGVYNVCDDKPVSLNELIKKITFIKGGRVFFLYVPKSLVFLSAKFGDFIGISFNSFILKKITSSLIASNKKLVSAIGKALPISSEVGLLKTFLNE